MTITFGPLDELRDLLWATCGGEAHPAWRRLVFAEAEPGTEEKLRAYCAMDTELPLGLLAYIEELAQ